MAALDGQLINDSSVSPTGVIYARLPLPKTTILDTRELPHEKSRVVPPVSAAESADDLEPWAGSRC
jgi:hypothetical protein